MQKSNYWILILLVSIISLSKTEAQIYHTGSVVKDFSLPDVGGKLVALSDFKNAKAFIIVFTSNVCPFSKLYEERLNDLSLKYKVLGIHLITINPNDSQTQPEESFEKMKARSKEKNIAFPYLFDENQNISILFNPIKTPQAFVLSVDNNVYKIVYSGAIDDNSSDKTKVKIKYVENVIDELVSDKKITIASSKPVGCTVKWKKN